MEKVVITSILNKNQKDAGPKAKNDDRKILIDNGFSPLDIVVPQNRLKKLVFAEFKLGNEIKKNTADEYIIQYPLYSILVVKKLVAAIRKYNKNAKIIILIHDIESLRLRKDDLDYKKKELGIFNSVDALIVHNESMQNYLKQLGVSTPMVAQGVFDYINNFEIAKSTAYDQTICFAGNLAKSTFLNKLTLQSSKCEVFGLPKPQGNYNEGVIYKGAYPADELPKYLSYNMGLIWDGTSLETNDGVYGEYTKYNSPHKASLYLSCGIPVIVWNKAGIASFIQDNNLGICVESIKDLDTTLNNISENDYEKMKKNSEEYAERIRKGKNIMTAVKKCEEQFVN